MSNSKSALRVATDFLHTMARVDPDGLTALLTDDVLINAPYAPTEIPLPRRNVGKEACRVMLHAMMGGIESFEWSELDLHATDDPDLVFGTGSSRVMMKNGHPYGNRYCFKFVIKDEKVQEYHEYFDPALALEAFRKMA